MAHRNLSVFGLPPDPAAWEAAVKRFCRESGHITAFEDPRLVWAHSVAADEDTIEIVPWGELLGRIGHEVGLRTKALPNKGQLQAAVEFACDELLEDSVFGRCKHHGGFHESLADALGELEDWGLTSEKLEEVVSSSELPPGHKIRELSTLAKAVTEGLETLGKATSAYRGAALLSHDFPRASHVGRLLVLAGSSVKPHDIAVLQKLLAEKVEVVVLVEQSPGAFEGGQQIAATLGQPLKPAKKAHWTEAIFEGTTASSGPNVTIFSAADRLSECEWALRLCQDAISRDGVMEHRIAILATDSETYVPLLMASAKRFDIRLEARVLTPLLTNGFAHLIARIVGASTSLDLHGLARLAKSTYLATSQDTRREIQTEVQRLHAAGGDVWGGIREFANARVESIQWLWPILGWRERALSAERTLSEWHAMMEELLRLNVLETAAQDLSSEKRRHDVSAMTAILRAIADYAPGFDRRRQRTLNLHEFERVAQRLWDREMIYLPSAGKGIRVVANPIEIGEAEWVVALGMLEGAMPRRRSEDPVLYDADRAWLSEHAHVSIPMQDSFFKARAQRDTFLRLCGAAKSRLVLGYPQTEEDRDNVPTSFLDEVERAADGRVERLSFQRKHIVPERDECRLVADLELREAMEHAAPTFQPPLLTLPEARQAVRPDLLHVGIRPEEAGRALQCAFRAAASYRLHLSSGATRLERKLNQLPLAAKVLNAPDLESAERAILAELRGIREQLSGQADPWEFVLLEAGADRLIPGWLKREFRARELWPRDPETLRTQVPLSDEMLRDEITVDGRKIRFVGEIEGLYHLGPYLVLQFFRQSIPDFSDRDLEQDRWLPFAIRIAGAMKAKRPIALDIDASSGERKLIILEPATDAPTLLNDSKVGLTRSVVEISRREFADECHELLRRAVTLLEDATMRATPGEHCNQCEFGELCRVSAAQIDIEDLIGAETADV